MGLLVLLDNLVIRENLDLLALLATKVLVECLECLE